MVTARLTTCANADAMLRSSEKSISRKKTGSSIEKFPSLVILQRLQQPIIHFPPSYLLAVAYGRLKTKENFKFLALKVVAVSYERWSLTRGSQCSDLTKKLLVFWKTGRLREMVATGGLTVCVCIIIL